MTLQLDHKDLNCHASILKSSHLKFSQPVWPSTNHSASFSSLSRLGASWDTTSTGCYNHIGSLTEAPELFRLTPIRSLALVPTGSTSKIRKSNFPTLNETNRRFVLSTSKFFLPLWKILHWALFPDGYMKWIQSRRHYMEKKNLKTLIKVHKCFPTSQRLHHHTFFTLHQFSITVNSHVQKRWF